VSTSVSEKARTEREGSPPDWSPVPERRDGGEPSRLKIAWRALAAAAVVTVLWLIGHEPAAIVLAVVLVTVTVLSATVPAFARVIDRGEGAIQKVAGTGLRFVLLGAMQLIVFTPVSLVLRLLRHDPLALGAAADDTTFWRPAPARPRALHRHLYTYERFPVEGVRRDSLPLPGLRKVLGLIVLLLALDVGAGAVFDAIDGKDDTPRATGSANSQMLYADIAAGRDEPWRVPLSWDITHAWDGKTYDPYLGWRLTDFKSRYVHVKDGIRRSYEPAGLTGAEQTVYFFGGSAMFGWFQRDEHTIPSELARLAEADGLPLRVVNYGTPAYVNWQESLQLQSLLSAGHRPDVAVFYDGANELVSQFSQGPHSDPETTLTRQIGGQLGFGLTRPPTGRGGLLGFTDAWARVSVVHRLGERVGVLSDPDGPSDDVLVSPWLGTQNVKVAARGSYAASIYSRGVDVVRRLADSYGIRANFFWQPSVYSKRVLEGEQRAVGSLGTDPAAWTLAAKTARAALPARAVDLSTVLDSTRKPLMYDFVHTNELGARIVAQAIYRRLRPQLLEAARERP
jgi:lysophospholipase L1-like esterase